MSVHELDPLTDSRWPRFVEQHPEASIFHTREWLDAIRRTYGYKPVAFTTTNSDSLSNGLVFCHINSWLTGRRLVSLPFSDHCQPLAVGNNLSEMLQTIRSQRKDERQRYIELRPRRILGLDEQESAFSESATFSFQTIDLSPDLKAIYGGFHDSCIRRKIKRAERENLIYDSGRSEKLLKQFRHLLLLTRRRHKLPPQPASWFQNIIECLGKRATIHVASKDGTPVASIMTLIYNETLVYKYGCSDGHFSNLGGTPFLFWKAIQQAKEAGIKQFDLGRSDHDEPGLIAFKEHLGATSSELIYYRDPVKSVKTSSQKSHTSASTVAREALVRLPDSMLAGVGQVLYRHIG